MSTPEPYEFAYSARSPRTVAVVGGILLLIAAMWLILNAAWWVVVPLTLLTLPALYDIGRNHSARIEVSDQALSWRRGDDEVAIPFAQIDNVRVKLGMDFSQKITVYRTEDGPIRIPLECIPRGRGLTDALSAHGVTVARSFFI